MLDYGGVAFVRQDDPYRCNLPDVGGAVQTRCNTGKVRVAHLFGVNASGMRPAVFGFNLNSQITPLKQDLEQGIKQLFLDYK